MAITTYDQGGVTVPKARIKFAPQDGINADFEDVQCYMGLADPFTANVTTTSEPQFSAECGVDQQIDEIEAQITRAATLQVRNLTDDAVAWFWIGDKLVMVKTAATGVSENLRLVPGKYYQLGKTQAFPSGTRDIANFTLGTLVEDVDYELDELMARVYIKTVAEGFSGTPGAVVAATYDQNSVSWNQVRSGRPNAYRGPISAEACNFVRGQPRDYYFPDVVLRPGGDHVLKQQGSTPVVAPLAMTILAPSDGRAAVYVDGMPFTP